MTQQQKKEIIQCLIDAGKSNELIATVRFIKCSDTINPIQTELINDLIAESCSILGYELNEANNKNRNPALVACRDAVIRLIIDEYDDTYESNQCLSKMLNKDRSSIYAAIKRIERYIETNDGLFMSKYSILREYYLA